MIDIHPTLMCRICLEDGAIYPIFESNDEFESIYTKLAVCIKEKLENIPGYPTNICLKCKNTSDTICNFISKFEETCSKLDSEIPKVKTEYLESLSDLDDDESAAYELQIDNMVLDKPKVEIKDPTELLEPLKHLTVKRIKLQNDASETRNSVDDKDVKRKKPKPRKTVAQNSAKNNKHATKSASKLTARKKKIAKPSGAANNNGVTKTAINSKTAKNFKNVEIQRKEDNNETTLSISYALCHLCGETFKDKDLLKRHTLKMHTERKFRCSKCHKAFLTTEILKEHQKCHENDIRSHICKTCGSGFYNKKGLNSHLRSVHTEKKPKPTYKCRFCEKTYSYRRGIVVHERSEHTGERPEVCSVCDRRFYDKVYLAEHMRIHSGHTPYKCPICSRGFTQCSNMKSHMHHNHRIKDLSPELLAKMKPNYLKILKP